MNAYMDAAEVAELLGISFSTFRKQLGKTPNFVPPKMHFVASKMLRWRRQEVENWIVETGWTRPSRSLAALAPNSQNREKRL